jgi:3-phosphoshikimate 1-carboxyvinyltransferase
MFSYLGIPLTRVNNQITIKGIKAFSGREIDVPGDISSAAFFMVAASLVPDSELTIKNVGVNPTRTGIIEVLHRMGAPVEIKDERIISGEPRGEIEIRKSKVESRKLEGIEIGGELIPRLIDEIPIIAMLATQAHGKTIIKDAKELRVKESDRIKTVAEELRKMGAKITETEDGMIIEGPTKLKGAKVESHGDHRLAMSLAVAGLIAEGETEINNTDCIETSFPGFKKLLDLISRA